MSGTDEAAIPKVGIFPFHFLHYLPVSYGKVRKEKEEEERKKQKRS